MNILVIGIIIFLANCSIQSHLPKEAGIHCGIDQNQYSDYKLISFAIQGQRLSAIDLKVFQPYEVTKKGCVLIPSNAVEVLKVKSGDHASVLDVKSLPKGLSREFEMTKNDINDPVFSYCGESNSSQLSFLKFLNPEDVNEESYFVDTTGKKTTLILNSLFCASVPKDKGKIIYSEGQHQYILEEKPLHFIEMFQPKNKGFINSCKKEGKTNKIIELVLNELGKEDCKNIEIDEVREIFNNTPEFLKSKEIENIYPLADIDVEALNLSNNRITDITPLQEMKNLSHLILSNNKLLTLEGLPESIRTLEIDHNSLLKNLKHLPSKISMMSVSFGNLESSYGLEKATELQSLSMSFQNNLKECDISNLSSKINYLVINSNKCFAKNLQAYRSPMLTSLQAHHCGIKTMSWLNNFPNIASLELNSNAIKSLDGIDLSSFKSLHEITLFENLIGGHFQISSNSIKAVIIHSNEIEKINIDAPNLERLTINRNRISDLSPLKENLLLQEFDYLNPKVEIKNCPTESVSSVVKEYCEAYKASTSNT